MTRREGLLRLAALFMAVWLGGVALPADAGLLPGEGEEFEVVAPAMPLSGDKPVVEEVFNFKCPHCDDMAPVVEAWEKKQQGRIELRLVPVYWGQQTDAPLRAFFAAQFMGMGREMAQAIFEGHFRRKVDIESPEALARLAAPLGLAPEEMLKQMKSFGVGAKVSQALARWKALGVDSTPTLVVNGRFRISTGHARGDFNRMLATAERLALHPPAP
ncbi:MAG: thiol:disulfide interchange protein DsbA/DsbL [Magnetococcales bacterium]|nr:thiol:disulfide interchange protein DsbA/DsbL [Magnetococcales bacterium]